MAMVEGLARYVQLREGTHGVLRFEVELQGGGRIPVRMRGASMEGALNDGDRVRFDAELDEHGVAFPQRVRNLSNGSTIELRPESVAHRLRGMIEHPVVSSILSGVLVFVLTLPFTAGGFSDRSPSVSQSSLGPTTSTRTGGSVFPPPSTSLSTTTTVLPSAPEASGSSAFGILLSLALSILAASVVFIWAARRRVPQDRSGNVG